MKTLSPSDPFWDELGVAWTAIHPEIAVIMPRLQARIRRQSVLITAGLILGPPAVIAALIAGVDCIWVGWKTGAWNFMLRGAAFLAIAAIVSLAMRSLLHVRAGGGLQSVPEMLDFAIARSRKTLLAIRLGYYACGLAALFGLVGTAIRKHLSRPPALSPFIDLALLAVFVLGLFFYGRRIQGDVRKYTLLRRLLIEEKEGQ
jgi:hypothetical protein